MSSTPPPETRHPSRTMQWAGFFATAVITLAILILPIIAAYITHNLFFLTPTMSSIPLGFMWYKLSSFLYPKRPEDYALAMRRLELQIKALEGKQLNKKRVP